MVLGVMFLIYACKENESEVLLNNEPGELVNVKFSLGGEVSFQDVPLSGRSAGVNDEQTYFLVNVKDEHGASFVNGVFDHFSDTISLRLFKDSSYTVEMTALRKGETYGLAIRLNSAGLPTLRINRRDNELVIANSFDLARLSEIDNISGIHYYTESDSSRSSSPSNSMSSPVEAFYGKKTIESVGDSDSVINIRLIRNVTAYEAILSGHTRGRIFLRVGDQSDQFDVGGDSVVNHTLSYPALSNDSSFYAKNWRVLMIHQDTIESIPVSSILYDQIVPFRRLHRKRIFITAPADTVSGGGSGSLTSQHGFSIELEDVPIIEGDTLNID